MIHRSTKKKKLEKGNGLFSLSCHFLVDQPKSYVLNSSITVFKPAAWQHNSEFPIAASVLCLSPSCHVTVTAKSFCDRCVNEKIRKNGSFLNFGSISSWTEQGWWRIVPSIQKNGEEKVGEFSIKFLCVKQFHSKSAFCPFLSSFHWISVWLLSLACRTRLPPSKRSGWIIFDDGKMLVSFGDIVVILCFKDHSKFHSDFSMLLFSQFAFWNGSHKWAKHEVRDFCGG